VRSEYGGILALCDQVDRVQVNLSAAMLALLQSEVPMAHQDEIVGLQRAVWSLAAAHKALTDAAKSVKEGG
jgi:hypothetical protein